MKRNIYLVLAFLFLGIHTSTAQFFQKYGVSVKANIASQDIFEGDTKAVSFRSESVVTYGIGAYFETPIFPFLNLRSQISFIKKKANKQTQFFDPLSSIVPVIDPILNYLSLDLTVKAHLNKTQYNPFLIIGFRQDMLLERVPESKDLLDGFLIPINSIGNSNPLNENSTIGTVIEIGLEIQQLINCSIGINKDLSFASKQRFVSAKNHVVSINAEVNLSKLIHR